MVVESPPKKANTATTPPRDVQMSDATVTTATAATHACNTDEGVSASIHAIPPAKSAGLEPNTLGAPSRPRKRQPTPPPPQPYPPPPSSCKPPPAGIAVTATTGEPPSTAPTGTTPVVESPAVFNFNTTSARGLPPGSNLKSIVTLRDLYTIDSSSEEDNGFESSDEDDEEDGTTYTPLGLTYLSNFDRFPVEINDERVWEGVPVHKKISWSKIPGEKMIAYCGYAKPTSDFMVRNERIIDAAYYLSGARNIEILNTDVDGGPNDNPPHRQLQPHLIIGLTVEQAQALEENEYAVTDDSFVIFKPFKVPNPSFVAAIPGIPLRSDKAHHRQTVREAVKAALENVRPQLIGFLNVHHDRMPDNIPASSRYTALLRTLEVAALQTSKNGKDSVTWIVYLNPPTADTKAWVQFSSAVKNLPVVIGDYPYYAYADDYHCSGCHAMNHSSTRCIFRLIHGYVQGSFPTSNTTHPVNGNTAAATTTTAIPAPADNIFLSQTTNTMASPPPVSTDRKDSHARPTAMNNDPTPPSRLPW
ncbi:hypothetical protein BKA70DRAFT_1438523 [Coprinopsis sp. MPI-PUGE-AT-0042]|nr:hypothetical protein BKA70DRAFT_1438523 [Coprinopsis sp. MPI-PUGE-AT-0042]